ncbi:putative methionine--tRNA ligase [Apostasia shenzhenica]|uniref:methionine--tRNA ligase n=1 Tax=Apostasia shenzhenica TaxID=1088818 RepID=A0A2I0AQN2_9ASPA|nr:putative methionine--tRNA ligase [Apostasia shenzhenica]
MSKRVLAVVKLLENEDNQTEESSPRNRFNPDHEFRQSIAKDSLPIAIGLQTGRRKVDEPSATPSPSKEIDGGPAAAGRSQGNRGRSGWVRVSGGDRLGLASALRGSSSAHRSPLPPPGAPLLPAQTLASAPRICVHGFGIWLGMGEVRSKKTPKLPIPGKRNVLITSALPYVNNVPHLGNIIGCVLSADVFARYCRLRGYNTIYICGTDEYGTATETKAMEENCTPKEICDKYHAIHSEVYKWFDISFDEFGRTSTPQQTEHPILFSDGDYTGFCAVFQLVDVFILTLEHTMQLYCETCKRFLADRLVEGTCPRLDCNYESARGDQCEKCGNLLNPTELLDPKCKVCRNPPQIRDTDHLFLELPLLRSKLEEFINQMSVAGGWSQNAVQATHAWLKEGLKPRCITRDLKWGVPVPHEKYKDKVFYVWFDAPIGYVSITACCTPEWEQWWKNPDQVELFQFMGKDNVPFHTVMFPSTLLGTGEKWTLLKTISVTEYLNYESGKFSKSKGIGVFGNDAKDTNIPSEVWRYYLLTNRPEVSDTLFTWADLQAKLNSELLSNLGNFINRVLSFIAKPSGSGYDSIIPDAPDAGSHLLTKTFAENISKLVEQYLDAMEKVKLKLGLKTAMSISSEGNSYLQESQFWKLYKDDPSSCCIVMKTSAGLVLLLACLLEPFMPSFSVEVLRQLNLPLETHLSLCDENGDIHKMKPLWDFLHSGHKIGKPEPLFRELKDDEVESLRQRYAGSQADRIGKSAVDTKRMAEQLQNTKISESNSKKQQAKATVNAKPKASEAEISISRLDIRVGLIMKVQKHPDADSLYMEEIDVGEESTRTVVSGLVKHIPLEEMQNRKVCVLCNLKPATMRGIKSHAMVMAASNADNSKVELVDPPASALVGERITFPGYSGEPDVLLNAKSKLWEKLQVDLHTDAELIARYKDAPFTTNAGICKVLSIASGIIRERKPPEQRTKTDGMARRVFTLLAAASAAFMALAVAGVGAQQAVVTANYHLYRPERIGWDYNAAHTFCSTWDAGNSVQWRRRYGWVSFCGPAGPVGQLACGKCLLLTNIRTKDVLKARIVDMCTKIGMDIDVNVFQKLDSDGQGYHNGYLKLKYQFVKC